MAGFFSVEAIVLPSANLMVVGFGVVGFVVCKALAMVRPSANLTGALLGDEAGGLDTVESDLLPASTLPSASLIGPLVAGEEADARDLFPMVEAGGLVNEVFRLAATLGEL